MARRSILPAGILRGERLTKFGIYKPTHFVQATDHVTTEHDGRKKAAHLQAPALVIGAVFAA
jgi:hypothetical protein